MDHQTNTKDKWKVELPTKVATKEENHPMWDSKEVTCLDKKVSVKAYHILIADRMLEGSFLSKASSLKPRPNCLHHKSKI